jgi:UDP-glucose 4-epimerase
MSYVLFGGDGFLGRAFRRTIAGDDKRVTVIGRSENIVVEDARYFSINKHSLNDIYHSIGKPADTVIIDFAYASVPKTSFENPIKDFSVNLNNIVNHLEFAKQIKAAHYIYISSGGTVYGNGDGKIINEAALNFPISPYGITKMACERYVNMYHAIYGIKTCIVRPSNVYGPGQKPYKGQGIVATALAQAYKSAAIEIFGYKDVIRDYIFVDDFCRGLDSIIKYGEDGAIYNLGFGKGYSISDVIKIINDVLSSEGIELNYTLSKRRPYDVARNVLDITKLQQISNWRPEIDLEVGVQYTSEWIKNYLSNLSR